MSTYFFSPDVQCRPGLPIEQLAGGALRVNGQTFKHSRFQVQVAGDTSFLTRIWFGFLDNVFCRIFGLYFFGSVIEIERYIEPSSYHIEDASINRLDMITGSRIGPG